MPTARKEDGAVLVEFAIVAPVLLLLVIGMLQFGLVLNAWIDETHLTSSGARYAAVNQNPDPSMTLPDYIKSQADTADLRDTAKVCVAYPTNPDTSTAGEVGDPVEVTMSYDYQLLPLIGGIALNVKGAATMRLEAVPADIPGGCST